MNIMQFGPAYIIMNSNLPLFTIIPSWCCGQTINHRGQRLSKSVHDIWARQTGI